MRRRDPPEPQAIDPASGFKVPHRNLVRQYDGEYVDRRFVDKQNPQDFVRARAETSVLPNPRPESADVFLTTDMLWEDGITPIMHENGGPIILEGSTTVTLP